MRLRAADFDAAPIRRVHVVGEGVSYYETRLDYGIRIDDQPVYVGRAVTGTATSETEWTVEKVTYDISDRPTRKQVALGSWDNRTNLF